MSTCRFSLEQSGEKNPLRSRSGAKAGIKEIHNKIKIKYWTSMTQVQDFFFFFVYFFSIFIYNSILFFMKVRKKLNNNLLNALLIYFLKTFVKINRASSIRPKKCGSWLGSCKNWWIGKASSQPMGLFLFSESKNKLISNMKL